MTEAELPLSDEDRQLIVAHYPFYLALDTGTRIASTEAQERFVAVCRSTARPITAHELAYVHYKEFLRASEAVASDLVSSQLRLDVSGGAANREASPEPPEPHWTEEMLSTLMPRRRTILKLRNGCLPLSEVELTEVLAEKRSDAVEVRPRSLREIGSLMGVSKERVRQIENRAMEQLGFKLGK